MKLERFEVVESTAGRDEGCIYLVSEILDENFVLLIDGKTKPISKPKRKKVKHLKTLGVVESELCGTFEDKSRTNDGVIKKILKNTRFQILSAGAMRSFAAITVLSAMSDWKPAL